MAPLSALSAEKIGVQNKYRLPDIVCELANNYRGTELSCSAEDCFPKILLEYAIAQNIMVRVGRMNKRNKAIHNSKLEASLEALGAKVRSLPIQVLDASLS